METEKRNTWKSETGYILSMLGTAVGFANLLGFSSQCYRNGGGAFLIPFFLAMLVLGIPMLVLEGIVGQKLGLPLVSAYGHFIKRRGKFFGWLAVIAVCTIGAFYTILTGWSLAYTYFSGAGLIPQDTGHFFVHEFLKDSGSLSHFGSFAVGSFVSALIVAVFAWYVISKNIQSGIESWCSFFLPMLTFIIIAFAGAVALLPGSGDGLYYYLKPDFSKLFNFQVWRDVFGHLFFSFSLGIGIVVGYSRHTDVSANIRKAMFQVAFADFLISFISGFVIFGSMGYLSKIKGVPFEEIVRSTSIFDIGYEIFPIVLRTFGDLPARFLGPIFFFSLFIAGITGVFSIVESIAGNIEVEYNKTRKQAVTIAMTVMFAMSLFFCMGNGLYIIDALSPMVLGNNMLIGGIAQIIVFMYMAKGIRNHSVWYSGNSKSWGFYALKFVSPILLITILFFAIVDEVRSGFGLPEAVRWSWFFLACVVSAYLAKTAEGSRLK